jgi:hypothetical protein
MSKLLRPTNDDPYRIADICIGKLYEILEEKLLGRDFIFIVGLIGIISSILYVGKELKNDHDF